MKLIITLSLLLVGISQAQSDCGNNHKASELAQLIINHAHQNRSILSCNKKLDQIAALKVKWLKDDKNIHHQSGGLTPNALLKSKGYRLSKRYPPIGNQVEIIAAGEPKPAIAFKDFYDSKTHRILMLGEHPFFQKQNEMGVAYLYDKNSPYEHYWVVLFGDTLPADQVDLIEQQQMAPIKK